MLLAENAFRDIASVLTLVGGNIGHADAEHRDLAPALPSPSPNWLPVRTYGGHWRRVETRSDRNAPSLRATGARRAAGCTAMPTRRPRTPVADRGAFWGAAGLLLLDLT